MHLFASRALCVNSGYWQPLSVQSPKTHLSRLSWTSCAVVGERNPSLTLKINNTGIQNVLELAVQHNLRVSLCSMLWMLNPTQPLPFSKCCWILEYAFALIYHVCTWLPYSFMFAGHGTLHNSRVSVAAAVFHNLPSWYPINHMPLTLLRPFELTLSLSLHRFGPNSPMVRSCNLIQDLQDLH